MTIQELFNMFQGQIPDELKHLIYEMKRLSNNGWKPTIKSCLGASGSKRYYYVAADTTYMFDLPCGAVSTKVKLNNQVWYIYFRHGNAWLKRGADWVAAYVANRPLDHIEPMTSPDALVRWVWFASGQGVGSDPELMESWNLLQDACYRLWDADKVEDPKEEPKLNEARKQRKPREPRLAKKDVKGPELSLDF